MRAVILIRSSQRRVKLDREGIVALSRFVLEQQGYPGAPQLSLYFVNNEKIRILNKRYLKRDHPTDVIAFSMLEGEDTQEDILGDVVISTEQALINAERFGTTAEREISRYIIHGILHLLGFEDHGERRGLMRKREKMLLSLAGRRKWRSITY